MQNCWSIPGGASGLKPPSPSSDEALLPPPFPPDPPDPHSPLSLNQYPPLSEASKKLPRSASRSPVSPTTDVVMTQSIHLTKATGSVNLELSTTPVLTGSVPIPCLTANPIFSPTSVRTENFTMLPPTSNSPLLTNGATSTSTSAPASVSTSVVPPSVDPMDLTPAQPETSSVPPTAPPFLSPFLLFQQALPILTLFPNLPKP
ncbi:unnamed protein product [Brassica rapa subsp. trilocularis]